MSSPEAFTVSALKAVPNGEKRPFSGLFALLDRQEAKTKKGDPFFKVKLGDKTGTFRANVWSDSALFDTVAELGPDGALRIEGVTNHYQDNFSPDLLKAEAIPEDELAGLLHLLVPSSFEDPEALWSELFEHIGAIPHEGLRETARTCLSELGDGFKYAPGAKAMHHAYRSGLLEHTVRMARCARALLPLYPEVDPSLALAGILLHDTGKVHEYEGTFATTVSELGRLQGHVVLGYRAARKAALQNKLSTELTERLEHVILSHQGELAWGAAVMACTPEAVFVSMIDNLDAKMGIIQMALRDTPAGNTFSDFMGGLQAPVLTTPPPTGD